MAKKPRKASAGDSRRTVTPYVVVRDADRAIDFYRRAFGAEELMRMPGPGGKGVMHAELRIGDSIVYLCDESPDASVRSPESLGGSSVSLHLSVEDADATFRRAVEAGGHARMEPADMFWGHRSAKVSDPFGHEWGISTPGEDLSPEEIGRRAQAFFARTGQSG